VAPKKVIAVVGAPGAQGGGLVRAILADPGRGFAARAITRDPSSSKAHELRRLGAEVVAGDVDDEASLEKAFAGADGAYCVTFFWAHFSPEKELAEAHAMARAAKKAGVGHVIWSTLEDTRLRVPLNDGRMPTLMGRYKVPHFDAKGEANAAFTSTGLPVTLLHTSFYWDNFVHFGLGPKRGPDGVLALTMPMGTARLPGIAAEDIGRCALGLFERGPARAGGSVGIAGEHLTGAEMAAAMTKAIGETVRFNDVPPGAYRGLGFPGAEDLGNMFQYKRDFEKEYCAARSVEFSRSLNPKLQDFAGWLSRSAKAIPLA
jgi:uncharacterized protein YbjT (DUF2867 family)